MRRFGKSGLGGASRNKGGAGLGVGCGILVGERERGRRNGSATQTRTDVYCALEMSSVEKLIRTMNARLPSSGSRWRIRGGMRLQAQGLRISHAGRAGALLACAKQ